MPMSLPRDAYVKFNGFRLSDHNRETIQQEYQRIENRVRTARGRMRKSYVADKRSFSIEWRTLPQESVNTVDGFWGARSIIEFYQNTPGEFQLSLTNEDGTEETYHVVFTDFSYTVVHRYDSYYYDVSLSVEEV